MTWKGIPRNISEHFDYAIQRMKYYQLNGLFIYIFNKIYCDLTGIPVLKYSEVLPNLYVGCQYGQLGKKRLAKLGIKATINLRIEFDDKLHELNFQHYCYLPTKDRFAPTLDQLMLGVNFIKSNLAEQNKVYIHCRSGIGRAPTLAIAYLIYIGYDLDGAIEIVRLKRPFIFLEIPQQEMLVQFQKLHAI